MIDLCEMLTAKLFLLACIIGPIAIVGGLEIDVAIEHSLDGGNTFNKAGTIQGDFVSTLLPSV